MAKSTLIIGDDKFKGTITLENRNLIIEFLGKQFIEKAPGAIKNTAKN